MYDFLEGVFFMRLGHILYQQGPEPSSDVFLLHRFIYMLEENLSGAGLS